MHNSRTDHLVDMGMMAYHSHLYDAAAERLQKALEWNEDDWTARLFLGMSCLKGKHYADAHSAFRYIYERCPNPDMRETARSALELIKGRAMH